MGFIGFTYSVPNFMPKRAIICFPELFFHYLYTNKKSGAMNYFFIAPQ